MKKVQETLTLLATMDSLSGLYNRVEFTKLAQRELCLAKIDNEDLSILMIDIDKFKDINDSFGHAAGDEVIREMGQIIMSSFRKTDFAGRLGGDEFVVLLKNAAPAEANRIAEKLRKTVSKTKVLYGEQEISLTISVGVASLSADNNSDIENILKQADDALYKAKAEGRNRVVTVE
jgi:diguanylate cyclase (GGDEF)-like protein